MLILASINLAENFSEVDFKITHMCVSTALCSLYSECCEKLFIARYNRINSEDVNSWSCASILAKPIQAGCY